MTTLLEIREMILAVYSRYELYVDRLLQFLAVLIGTVIINGRIGYMETLTGTLPTLLIALLGALLPAGGAVAVWAVVILLHLYTLSLEAAIVGAGLFLLMILIYFRFTPGDSQLLVAYPICSALGIPYALPIAGGLLSSPAGGCTVAMGVIADRFLLFVRENEAVIQSSELDVEAMLTRFQFLIDGLIGDEVMIIRAAAVIAAGILVYLVRRLSIPYAWIIASAVGAVTQLVVLLVGAVVLDTQIGVGASFLGVLGGLAVGVVISFFAFNLDYTRTESTQFEDDEYYYYVKAIPKSTYAQPRRTVKTINTHRPVQEDARGSRGTAHRYYSGDEAEWNTEVMRPDAYDAAENGYAADLHGGAGRPSRDSGMRAGGYAGGYTTEEIDLGLGTSGPADNGDYYTEEAYESDGYDDSDDIY